MEARAEIETLGTTHARAMNPSTTPERMPVVPIDDDNSESRQRMRAAGFLLGGVVGCSRAVTSAGWRPHTDQVGQTGTKVSPDLYIACGISGATQHIAGCKGAKKILAINSDAEAPILNSADYAVIGDLTEIVPAITAELRRTRAP